jgi:hypothetical protein
MSMSFPHLRWAAWLGALFLTASLPADCLAGVAGADGARGQSVPSVHPRPGSTGAPNSAASGRGRHLVLQVRGSS